MFKSTALAIAFAGLFAMPSFGDDWINAPILGAQGVEGAFAMNPQDGLFDLSFNCSATKGANPAVFMTLKTLPDAPLEPGNETTFPVTMSYMFSDGSSEKTGIEVDWARDDHGVNVWYATFPMNKAFLKSFGRAVQLEIVEWAGHRTVFTYAMGGSAAVAQRFAEYCGN